jgi:hypothetical protein
MGWRNLGAAYATLDRRDEAKAVVVPLLQLSNGDGMEMVHRGAPFTEPKAREYYLEGPRQAAMPD